MIDEYKSLLNIVENGQYIEYFDSTAKVFREVQQIANESGDNETVRFMEFEIEAAYLYTRVPFSDEYSRRFDKKIDLISDEQIHYYLRRFTESCNIYLRFRYGDILLDYKGKEQKSIVRYRIFKEFIPILIEIAGVCLKQNEERNFINHIARGVELALAFNNDEYISKLASSIYLYLEVVKERDFNFRWVLDSSFITKSIYESKLNKNIEPNISCILIDLLDNGAKLLGKEDNHLLQRAFYKEIILWMKLLKYPDKDIREYEMKIGESFEDESESQQGRQFKSESVKARYLEMAMKYYSDIGEKEKVDQMKVAIRHSYIAAASEFKEIKAEMELPEHAVKIINSVWDGYRKMSLNEVLVNLSIDTTFIPNVDRLELLTREQQEIFPLQSLFPKGLISNGKKIFEANTIDEKLEMRLNENYMIELEFIIKYLLLPVFSMAIDEKFLSSDLLMDKLRACNHFMENNLKIIDAGVKCYFNADYISSLHVLVPQLEACIRNIFSQANYSTTSIKKNQTQHEETFNEFLKREEVIQILGKRLHKYLQIITVEQTGLNLRNEIAHGLIIEEACNEAMCTLILHLLLILTNLEIKGLTK